MSASSTRRHGRRGVAEPPQIPARVAAAFDYYDANGSGFIDYRELRPALRCGIDLGTEFAMR